MTVQLHAFVLYLICWNPAQFMQSFCIIEACCTITSTNCYEVMLRIRLARLSETSNVIFCSLCNA